MRRPLPPQEYQAGLCQPPGKAFAERFLDVFADYLLKPGCGAETAFEAKLRGARCVVVVLSVNFEASSYCLEELCVALERRSFVLPIFLDREPAEWDDALLRNTSETLCSKKSSTDAAALERWRMALGTEGVGGIAGWVHRRNTECVLLYPL